MMMMPAEALLSVTDWWETAGTLINQLTIRRQPEGLPPGEANGSAYRRRRTGAVAFRTGAFFTTTAPSLMVIISGDCV